MPSLPRAARFAAGAQRRGAPGLTWAPPPPSAAAPRPETGQMGRTCQYYKGAELWDLLRRDIIESDEIFSFKAD